ncbi:ATP-binding protein [Clostridium tetani]|uniref:ATP-binding protein n=1 Tax=Clostridium tetani TaxID=1513 RepID=UPI001027A371|nr:ATP-binding protein [Clostridium tetani]RXI70520.1 MerR family transcriptional regulator [Clostridium tetani]
MEAEACQNLNTIISRIRAQQEKKEQNNTICPIYSCNICGDTTWIKGENGVKRCTCYRKNRIKELWESFGVSLEKVKTINSYRPFDDKTEEAKKKAINYIKDFKTLREKEKNWFGLFGQNGAGKTHLIVGLGAALIKENVQVLYMPYVEAIRDLKSNVMDDEYYKKMLGRFQKADVLIIDDLFKDKTKNGVLIGDITETDIKHFYPILNYRYNNKLPILFSTECTPGMLLKLDEAQCGRIIEKCEDRTVVFKGAKYNYRMKDFIK